MEDTDRRCLWTAIVTQSGENILITSVRRAHPKEGKFMHRTDSITSQEQGEPKKVRLSFKTPRIKPSTRGSEKHPGDTI